MAIVTRSPAEAPKGLRQGLLRGLLGSPATRAVRGLLAWLLGADAWQRRMRALRRGMRRAWPRLRASRLALLVFLCGAGFLLGPSQTEDLMAKLADQTQETIWFVLSVFFLSFSLWYWARWSLTLTCGRSTKARRLSLRWIGMELPRWLAALAAFAAAFAFLRGAGLGWAFFLCLLGGFAFYALCTARSKLPRHTAAWRVLNRDQAWLAETPTGLSPRAGRYAGLRLHRRIVMDLDAAPFGRSLSLLMLALAALPVVLFPLWPAYLAAQLGAPAITMLGLAVVTTLFSVPALGIARHTGLPALLLGLGLGAALAYTSVNNHDLRLLGRTDPGREPIARAAERWLEDCAARLPRNAAGRVPVVLVGTAGGASRAALWTTTVLQALAAEDRHLHGRTFAVSGVSGGSFGAAVWSALLAEAGVDCASGPQTAEASAARADLAAGAIDQDYLAAPMGSLFLTDLVWRHATPLNALLRLPGAVPGDRAAALERAWEWGYRRATRGGERMAESFLAPWRSGDGGWSFRRPLLFLNGTVQSSGLPIVAAPVALEPADFPASHDLLGHLRAEIRLSTAVAASARFPYITPAGGLRDTDGTWRANVVDGGYFDNQGAGTLTDVARVLLRAAEGLPDGHPLKGRLDLVVVQVSSDPDRGSDELGRCRHPRRGPPDLDAPGAPSGLDAPLAPLRAVTATQSAHTVRTAANLVRLLCGDERWDVRPPEGVGFLYAHFRLCGDGDKGRAPPLNWSLPGWAVEHIRDRAMRDCEGNAEELGRYRALVR